MERPRCTVLGFWLFSLPVFWGISGVVPAPVGEPTTGNQVSLKLPLFAGFGAAVFAAWSRVGTVAVVCKVRSWTGVGSEGGGEDPQPASDAT